MERGRERERERRSIKNDRLHQTRNEFGSHSSPSQRRC